MVNEETFQFSSGARHYFPGFGEWLFSLDRDGRLHVEQFVGNQKKHDQVYTLTKEEDDKCWACIDALQISTLKGSDRMGVPDEAQYKLGLVAGSRKFEVKIWANDVDNRPDLKKLVGLIKELLAEYSKKDVVI